MEKSKEYVKNTAILFIGKFATQFISVILLPLYTYFLDTTDYGIVDLLQTYITLFMPIFLLRIDYAVFRFLIDTRNNKNEKEKVITNVILTLIIEILIFIFLAIILKNYISLKYYNLVVINIVTLMISNTLLQTLRGDGKVKDYSISCIITALTTLIFNVFFIVEFNLGAKSLLISSIIANLLCTLYILVKNRIIQNIKLKLFDKAIIENILKYSIPLIPNALSWWIVNVSDRTIIVYFLNAAANGIYTVSCKFANILNSIFSIFSMSWQEAASLHIDDDDGEEFISNMINKIFMLFATIVLGIIVCIPLVFNIVIGEEYKEAYNYIPIVLLGNLFSILTSLIGGIYVAKKMTKEISKTTILSAIINIILNVAFIKNIGLYAASISTVIAYLSMSIYRCIDVQRYLKVKLEYKKIVFYFLIFTLSVIVYYINNLYLNIMNFVIVLIYGIIINKELLLSGQKIIEEKILKRGRVK